MGFFKRINDVIASNANATVSKMEDPVKMVDYQYTKVQKEVTVAKQRAASVKAEEKNIKDQLDAAKKESQALEECAIKAVQQGNDEDAKVLLSQKAKTDARIAEMEKTYATAQENSDKMLQLYNDMVTKRDELDAKRGLVKTKTNVARTQKALYDMKDDSNKESPMAVIERMEAKADRMGRKAEALDEITQSEESSNVKNVMAKYGDTFDVESALAALKEKAAVSA